MSKPKDRNQHYLPAFLLRQFASKVEGRKHFVFLFRLGAPPKEVSIKDVAKERDFYGHPSVFPTEDSLDALENEFAPLIRRLGTEQPTDNDFALVATFVSHLIARTKNLRDGASSSLNRVLEVFAEKLTTHEIGAKWTNQMLALAQEELRKVGLNGIPDSYLRAALESEGFRNRAKELISLYRKQTNFDELVAKSHRNALAKSDFYAGRAEALKQLAWRVYSDPTQQLILGDCAVLARFEDKPCLAHPLKGSGTPEVIIVPISSSNLLVGEIKEGAFCLGFNEVNQSSAELSRDFFVSTRNTPLEITLQSQFLGKRSEILAQDEIEDLLA